MNKFTKRLKRKIRFNSKTNSIVLFLFAFVLLLGVGFAYINTDVEVQGAGKVTSSKWDVHFDNVQVNENGFNSVEGNPLPSIVDNYTVTFNVELDSPGDFYEFNIDVVNEGTIDAMINDIIISPELSLEQAKLFKYDIKYSDGVDLEKNQSLRAGETKTLKVLFKYNELEDYLDYSEENQSFEFSITINYVQVNEDAIDNYNLK